LFSLEIHANLPSRGVGDPPGEKLNQRGERMIPPVKLRFTGG
jgi:hypothetical protein